MDDDRRRALRLLAGNLGAEMRAQGTSSLALGRATEVPKDRVERILRAEVEAGAFEVMRLAAGLGVRPGALVGDLWDGPDSGPEEDPPAEDGRAGRQPSERSEVP